MLVPPEPELPILNLAVFKLFTSVQLDPSQVSVSFLAVPDTLPPTAKADVCIPAPPDRDWETI